MLKRIFLCLAAALVALQFIRSAENTAAESDRDHDVVRLYAPPENVKRTLESACYDCHSNHTRYPWYAQIQPMRWWMDRHVRDGRKQLNFSEFGRLPPARAQSKLEDCIDEVAEGRMPLRSYTLVHSGARLSNEQVEAFSDWAERVIEQLESKPEPK
ncbi:MAG TPA: heme-binding domain-containing protein [Opitutaceae bacterium]